MFRKILKKLLPAPCSLLPLTLLLGLSFSAADSQTVYAKPYKASSDTETQMFDYIENRRRERRANQLTEEQK